MSLNSNFSRVQNFQTVCWETQTGTREWMEEQVKACFAYSPSWSWVDESKTSIRRVSITTWTLMMASLQVGMSEITDGNWKAFFTRLSMLETVGGAFRRNGANQPVFFTPDDVKAHIGLQLNGGDTTTAKFNAQIVRLAKQNAEKQLK